MRNVLYDYLIVGSGLFGSIFAYEAKKVGKKVKVIEKRNHVGGNIYTSKIEDIDVHMYGPHIFHTNDLKLWKYIQQFGEFNNFINSPIAIYEDEVYNLPFNMNTFSKLWGAIYPHEAKKIIDEQIKQFGNTEAKNLEEQAINLVGMDIYKKIIKGYTEKQWGRECKELPPFIIKRLPIRYTYDNNYYNDRYQGIPVNGYTELIEKILSGIEVTCNCDYFTDKEKHNKSSKKIIYTGLIDEFFESCYGELEYRSLEFDTEVMNIDNFQGNAVVNYTSSKIPYTRIIEHKHFNKSNVSDKTVITREYSKSWVRGKEPYYPINDANNNKRYHLYYKLASEEKNIIFGGRLATYKYYDMNNVVHEALKCAYQELGVNSLNNF